jgi:hypothetical protein
MMRLTMSVLFFFFSVVSALAGGMVRIVSVVDSNTVTVDELGARSTVVLAGVSVPPSEEAEAAEHLRRTVASGWAMIERDPRDARKAWLYRSPDALSINGEMIRGAWHHPGTPMLYLGEADPGPRAQTTASAHSSPAPRTKAKKAAKPPRPRKIRR